MVARVAPGGKSCASPGRSNASKCLLRRQTESQRDSVHPRRLAREWRFWVGVGVGISDLIFQNVKSVITGVFDVFLDSGTGCGCKGCARREIIREPRTMPCLKVPAPQANRVAARLCPPQEAGWRGWHRSGRKRRRDRHVAAKVEVEDNDDDDDDFYARGDVRGGRGAGPTLRGRNMGSGPDIDMMGAAHGNPGRVWQEAGKPGC